MPLNVSFYSFTKRDASTAAPSSGGTSIPCEVYKNCSLYNPTIYIVSNIDGFNPFESNYAYIEAWGRYYWVTDWQFLDGLLVASLAVDVLASWKEAIGSTEAYILRASGEWDGTIIDTACPTSTTITLSAEVSESPWAERLEDGTYVVGVIGKGGGYGAATYYTFSQSAFNNFMSLMFANLDWSGLTDLETGDTTDISTNLVKCLFNPSQYLTTVYWLPYTPNLNPDQAVQIISFGFWQLDPTMEGAIGWLLDTDRPHSVTAEVAIPKHPQTSSRGPWVNFPPYTKYTLDLGPLGVVPLDGAALRDADKLDLYYYIDNVTGAGTCDIMISVNGENQAIYKATGQIGVPIQYASTKAGIVGQVAQAAKVIPQALENYFPGNDVSEIGTAIANGVTMWDTQVQAGGENGGLADFQRPIRLQAFFSEIVEDDIETLGRPLCATRQISSIPGFIKCWGASVECEASGAELERINQFLNAGFYYE